MAQDPLNTQSGGNTAFSQQAGNSQSNPFTGDMRGEFSSEFGTSTNAVSQIFNSSGFGGDNRNKMILAGVVGLAALVGGFLYFSSEPEIDPLAENPVGETKDAAEESASSTEGTAEDKTAKADEELSKADEKAAAPVAEPKADSAASAAATQAGIGSTTAATAPSGGATGSFSLTAPSDGATQAYDETSGPAKFEWQGSADRIVFARNSSMQPVVRSINLAGRSSYEFSSPYPGTWYWKVENGSGSSEVRSFTVDSPAPRNFPVSAPQSGGSLAANGGVVSWQAGERIASYRVELHSPGKGYANPAFRFGTSGQSVSLSNVTPGVYDVRVGAFSEVAGRWEWQTIQGVNVQ